MSVQPRSLHRGAAPSAGAFILLAAHASAILLGATAEASVRRVRRHVTPSTQSSSVATFYVATDGNDGWTGTLPAPDAAKTDGPFATFGRARAAVQALDKTGLTEVDVQFRAGTYFLPATVRFTSADSGSAGLTIVYRNYPGESPVMSGGVRVLSWTNTSGSTWKATLPASTQYFENLFYNGVRRLRPRLGGYLGTYYRFTGPVYLTAPAPPASAPEPNCSVYVTGKGWECFDRFQYNPSDPIADTWSNLAPPAGNPCGKTPGNTAIEGDIEVVDFEQYSVARLRVACVDTPNHLVYLTGPTAMPASYVGAHGFIANHRYIVENVEDALAQPGQWFLDRSATPWMLTYQANPGEDPNDDVVVIPQLAEVLVANDLQHVTFRGLTFTHDDYTVPPQGYTEPGPPVSAAVSFQNAQHVSFDGGTVAETSGVGLEFISCINSSSPSWCAATATDAVTADNTVVNSAFYDVGASGIRIGMPGRSGDTQANVPQFTTVENNVVAGFGRLFPAAKGIQQGDAHDNAYTHNEVYDGYHGAIALCFCSGTTSFVSNNVISFNHVHDLFQGIMNDGGSIYVQSTSVLAPYTEGTGNAMLNNRVHDVSDSSVQDSDGYGGDGLYVDDLAGQVDMENNLVYRVSGNAVSFSGPRQGANPASTVKNNILAFARHSLLNSYNPYTYGFTPPAELFFVATGNLFYFDRGATSSPPFYAEGGCTYGGGGAFTDFQQWNGNLYWRTDGGFASDAQAFHVQTTPAPSQPCYFNQPSKLTFYNLPGWQTIGEDTSSVVRNPGFANPAYPADDYSLPGGPPIPGFVVFDPTLAGRTDPVLHPPAVPATFPTKTFNPASDY